MKRPKVAHHENHERWLVSYADFITLMFAFFVVMFATAQTDKTKAREVSESVREALQHGQLASKLEGIINQRRVVPEGRVTRSGIQLLRRRPSRRKMLRWPLKRIW